MARVSSSSENSNGKDMVSVYVPKLRGAHPEKTLWVCVNGIEYNIPRGERVEVPKSVAEVIENSEHAKDIAEAYEYRAPKYKG